MTACQRSGCTGKYAPDGYCDECGHKARPAAADAGGSGATSLPGAGTSGATLSGAALSGAALSGAATRSGTSRAGTSRSTRGHLGANLVAVPPVPRRDPTSAVLADPQVPESHRFCGACGEPVGRGKDGQPGRAEGFCPRDRTPFSFKPKLKPGDLLDRRYEVLGCLAHGGLGWIYLGRDRNISEAGSDRWVVLKGLINTGDPDAAAAAVAERRFLVEVDHPSIVKIHDFAQHVDKAGESTGYIVMEYVGGRSLKDVALNHRGPDGSRAPLPLPQVLAYGIEILPALSYLHDRGLLFCDFKPDNVIHTEDQLKLIDLGAVRRVGDDVSALYGTPGYQAPELAAAGPSIGSDLYTVGRTLAVLSFDFGGFSTRFADHLPDRADVPLLRAEESYWRLLSRATHHDPARRFGSAVEMAEQMTGVLREVLAADGAPRPAMSANFTGERATFGSGVEPPDGPEVASALPMPLIDLADAGAGLIATLSGVEARGVIDALSGITPRTLEVSLRLVRAHLDAGAPDAAEAELRLAAKAGVPEGAGGPAAGQVASTEAVTDWRIGWHAGLIALARNDHATATRTFDAVYADLPGELAAQLALAAGAELAGDHATAAARYERVWRTDRGFTSAAFGLARARAAAGDRDGAIAALDEVPASSSQHVAARVAALRSRLSTQIGTLAEADFADAANRLDRLDLDTARQARLSVEMCTATLTWLAAGGASGHDGAGNAAAGAAATASTGGVTRAPAGGALRERQIRLRLEKAYRLLATLETDSLARYELVDRANAARPRTVI